MRWAYLGIGLLLGVVLAPKIRQVLPVPQVG